MRHTSQYFRAGLIVLLSVSLAVLRAQEPATSAEIRGSVRIRGGTRVSNVFVTAIPTDTTLPVDRRMGQQVAANDKGEFTIKGVRGGKFKLCISATWEAVLDPCEWSASPPLVDVPDGATALGVDIEVPKGQILRIHVDDPDRVIPTPVRPNPGKFIQLGVLSLNGAFHKARLVSTDRSGQNYELVVPTDSEFELVADTYRLEVRDEAGTRADGRERRRPVKSDAATLSRALRFSVRSAQQ